MKRLLQTYLALLVAAGVTGCASTGGYFIDRGRDAKDIVTVAFGYGGGVKVHVGPFADGLAYSANYAGLQDGVFFCGAGEYGDENGQEGAFIAYSFETSSRSAVVARRNKAYSSFHVMGMPVRSYGVSGVTYSRSYFTDINVLAGIGITVKLGFNLGELFDFVLGWATIDIFEDDLEAKKQRKKSEVVGAKTTTAHLNESTAPVVGGSTATTNNVKQIVSRTHRPSISPLAKAIALRLWGKDGAQMLDKHRIEPPIGRYETVMGPRGVTLASDQFVTDIRVDHATSNYWLIRSGGIGGVYQESGPFVFEGDVKGGTNPLTPTDP